MGFRDIQNFNMTMLAKQVWRLFHQNETLLYKVFGAKYFLMGSILDTLVPLKCSYAWRSILQSKDVIQKGAIWRVGDGWMVDIWNHRWLPDPGQRRVVSPRNGASVEKVCDRFYPNTKLWDIELLQDLFYPWEVDLIKKIYVSAVSNKDVLVWPLSLNGNYSVKSAYRLLDTEVVNSFPFSSGGECSMVWKHIWKIRAPQKIKHFIGQAAKDLLPSRQNLARWKILVDKTCSLCDDH